MHVVTGDPVDRGPHRGSEDMGQHGPVGFVEKQHFETLAKPSDLPQGLALEVVEEEIRDEDAAPELGVT